MLNLFDLKIECQSSRLAAWTLFIDHGNSHEGKVTNPQQNSPLKESVAQTKTVDRYSEICFHSPGLGSCSNILGCDLRRMRLSIIGVFN